MYRYNNWQCCLCPKGTTPPLHRYNNWQCCLCPKDTTPPLHRYNNWQCCLCPKDTTPPLHRYNNCQCCLCPKGTTPPMYMVQQLAVLSLFQGHYVYTEASGNVGETAVFLTPEFPASPSAVCLQFYYHMYGDRMGTLNIKVITLALGFFSSSSSSLLLLFFLFSMLLVW